MEIIVMLGSWASIVDGENKIMNRYIFIKSALAGAVKSNHLCICMNFVWASMMKTCKTGGQTADSAASYFGAHCVASWWMSCLLIGLTTIILAMVLWWLLFHDSWSWLLKLIIAYFCIVATRTKCLRSPAHNIINMHFCDKVFLMKILYKPHPAVALSTAPRLFHTIPHIIIIIDTTHTRRPMITACRWCLNFFDRHLIIVWKQIDRAF